jgi:methylmalonyl-CoA/ethylmalonyl-CoA epimerase
VEKEINLSSSWKIMQIGLVVRNMGDAVEKLSKLGFGPFIPKYLPPDSKASDINGNPFDAIVDVQRSMIGNVELELCQPVSGNSPHQEYLDSKGEGIQHILFEVQDLQSELNRLTESGATILLHIKFKGGGLAYVNTNTCGFIVELIQLPKNDPDMLKILLSR